MPFLTPIIAGGLGALGAGSIGGGALIISGPYALMTTGTLALAGQIASAVVTIGVSFGLNAALGLLNKKGPMQSTSSVIKQPLPGRFIDIGRVKTGGAIAFYASPDAFLYAVRILSCTRIEEIESVYLDDFPTHGTPLADGVPNNALNGPWFGRVVAQAYRGSVSQPALWLVTLSGLWTSDHRLRGMAALGLRYDPVPKEDFASIYPNGAPNPTVVIKGAMLPDPRDPSHDLTDPETWTYSENMARAILRYCLDIDGWGLRVEDLHLPSWQTACDDCDDLVATTSGTEPRYRCWGRYTTVEDRASTLQEMLAGCGGTLLEQPDGTLGLFVGKHREPDPAITITDQHILDVQLERFPNALDRVDGIKPRIVWQGAGWEEQECPTVYAGGDTYGAAPDVDDLSLRYCPSPYQGQRLGKAVLKQRRPEWQGTIKTTLHGLRCYGEPVVRIILAELDIDGTFEIIGQPVLDLSTMTVTLSVRSYAADTWTMSAEEMSDMAESEEAEHDLGGPAPENLVADIDGDEVMVTWDTVGGEPFAYSTQAQWREYDPGNGPDDGWTNISGASAGEATFTVSDPGIEKVDFRARRVSTRGFFSDWTVLAEIEMDA